MRLDGKRIVITGATGIAAAGARLFAQEGASVFVIARKAKQCEALAAEIELAGHSIGWALADLTDAEETSAAYEAATEWHGGTDGLFAVAGGSGRRYGDGPLHEATLEGWSKTNEINGFPTFLTVQAAVRTMLEQATGGSIVIVSSVLADHPVPSLFATHSYAAAKGGANSFARALAAFYAPDGVRVNAIGAGLVATPMSQRAAADPTSVDFAERKQPLKGGFLDAIDVAQAAAFLLSDASAQITGQVLEVDGGWGVTDAGS